MDDFRIWKRVITSSEVEDMYLASPETNATVSGTVAYNGSVPGPVIVWAFDENGTKVREQILSNVPGAYSFNLPAGHAYDLKPSAMAMETAISIHPSENLLLTGVIGMVTGLIFFLFLETAMIRI